jgi:hypothetical protein
MGLGALGEYVDVQRAVRQVVGEFQLRGNTDAAALPMVVHDSENPLPGRE